MKLRAVLLTIATTLALLGGTGVAQAADDTVTWGVKPEERKDEEPRANFVVNAKPGEKVSDAIVVRNHGDDELTLSLYAADGFQTRDGNLDVLPAGEESRGVGTWVEAEEDEITLAPRDEVEVPFTITVPEKATPGDHTGGIVTSLVTTADTGFGVDRRLGVRIHVRVAGPLTPQVELQELAVDHDGSWLPFGRGGATVTYELVNTGNTRVLTHPALTVTGPFETFPVTSRDRSPTELIPGARVLYTSRVEKVVPSIRISAEVDVDTTAVLAAEVSPPIEVSAGAWAVPWTTILLLVGVVGGAFGAGLLRRRQLDAERARVDAAVQAALQDEEAPVAG